jgi:uncharacterized protein YciI
MGMAKQHFFLRLIPPRPTFPHDMTDAERTLMREHAAYTKGHFDDGRVLIYGPVLAPTHSFGMAVIQVNDEAEARAMMEADPSVVGGLNTYELLPIHVAAARAL